MAARTASREPASIRSAIASACARSSLSFRKARWVNSPACARRARHERLDHQRPAVAMELEHVLARVGGGRREEERETGVDRLPAGIEKAREGRVPRPRQLPEHDRGDLRHLRAGETHDADTAPSRRRRGGHDGFRARHVPLASAKATAVFPAVSPRAAASVS
jgi:hypothetical protein